jgi:S1-C subfamily serine protease
MLRALVAATALLTVPAATVPQPAETSLHIKIVLTDNANTPRPVAGHALLISENPPTATPRRVVTANDGTANVHLRPGSYIVESDAPFAFEGKAYTWTRIVDVVAGRDTVLDLTAANAESGPVTPGATTSETTADVTMSSLLTEWQDSVLALWTPTTHASGFAVDETGLVATSQRAIGTAASVEVQLAADLKVAANIITSDSEKDVAVLRINPSVAGPLHPVPLGCGDTSQPPVVKDQEIVTIGSPLREPKGPRFGAISRVEPHALTSDLVIPSGSSGGPVFTSAGSFVGLTSVATDEDMRRRGNARIVRVEDVCAAVARARAKMNDTKPPGGAHLPVEPSKPLPADALKDMARRRAGGLSPYAVSSTDFDIGFITPVMIYGTQYFEEQMNARDQGRSGRPAGPGQAFIRPLLDFSNWSEYVEDVPPVLMVRVTPKLVEGFWEKVARGAAQTQGMAIPAFKHFRSGFARMQAFCGDAEVTPIHPFKLEHRPSETDTIYEGLYVFDPASLGPSCGSVKLVLYSDKEPQKGETRVVDPKIIQQIWQDFAPYRAE